MGVHIFVVEATCTSREGGNFKIPDRASNRGCQGFQWFDMHLQVVMFKEHIRIHPNTNVLII